jgi:hypothetical protein
MIQRRDAPRDRLLWSLVLSGLVLTLGPGGCATPSAGSPFERQTNPGQALTLRVENRNLSDVTVFVRDGSRRQEIGTVNSRGVEFFAIPWNPGRPLDLEIESAVGGERYRLSPYIYKGSGRLELIIAPELRDSVLRG